MHSSTGYGLTTSNPCMGVIQKGCTMCSPFAVHAEPFPALCPCGEHAPGRDAPAGAEHPCRQAGLHKRGCGLRSKTPGRRRPEEHAAARCAAAAMPAQGRCGRGVAAAARPGVVRSTAAAAASVSLDHFAGAGKMNHGGVAALRPRALLQFALSFHIGT